MPRWLSWVLALAGLLASTWTNATHAGGYKIQAHLEEIPSTVAEEAFDAPDAAFHAYDTNRGPDRAPALLPERRVLVWRSPPISAPRPAPGCPRPASARRGGQLVGVVVLRL